MREESLSDPLAKAAAHIDVEAIEEAFVAQWSNFGRAPGGTFHEDDGLVWTEAPISQLPYNAVLRTRLGNDAEHRIEQMIRHFRKRAVPFLWLVHPTAQPGNLAELLATRGLPCVERATGMSLDLTAWNASAVPPTSLIAYRDVNEEQDMRSYEELVQSYWELPKESHAYVFGVSRWISKEGDRGARWVAYQNGQPIGKAYLSYLGLEDTAAVFGVYVKPAARGHGIAGRLTELAIAHAARLGRKRVVLHSSEMAVNIYRRLGFIDRCSLPVHGSSPLHSMQPM